MRTRIVSLFLCIAVVICTVSVCFPASAANVSEHKVLYIPADDRPFNTTRVSLFASSLSIQLVMPDSQFYATVLDGQQKSPDSPTTRREKTFRWLKQNASACDTLIVSLDQLLSGGLMASRTLSDSSDLTYEYGVIDYLRKLAETKEIYVIDSIMRLATSVGYGDLTMEEYTIFRRYGMVGRPILSGDSLTVDNILECYQESESGSPAYLRAQLDEAQISRLFGPADNSSGSAPTSPENLYDLDIDPLNTTETSSAGGARTASDDSLLIEYLSIRERKLRLMDYSLRTLCGNSNIHYLMGIDDTSPYNNIQSNEIAYSQQFLDTNDFLTCTFDGLGQVALAHLFLSAQNTPLPSITVSYFGTNYTGILPFNRDPINSMVSQTISYLGCSEVETSGDICLCLYASSSSESATHRALSSLVTLLNENEQAKIPTILIDCSLRHSEATCPTLLSYAHLGTLLSFSGSCEDPNCITMGLSQGLATYMALQHGLGSSAEQNRIENLFSSLIKEFVYTGTVKSILREKILSEGINPDNYQITNSLSMKKQNTRLTDSMQSSFDSLLSNFQCGGYLRSVAPYTLGSVTSVTISNCSFPWQRLMEIDLNLNIQTSPSQPNPGNYHCRYVDGTESGMFSPNKNLTRAQAAKLLLGAAGTSNIRTGGATFPDVSGWAEPYIDTACRLGYIQGGTDGLFRPDAAITRGEFCMMLSNYVEVESITLQRTADFSFSDVASSDWFFPAVEKLSSSGIIRGYDDGSFRPYGNITRCEAVSLLNRLFDRSGCTPDSLLELERFSDVRSDSWYYSDVQEAALSYYLS